MGIVDIPCPVVRSTNGVGLYESCCMPLCLAFVCFCIFINFICQIMAGRKLRKNKIFKIINKILYCLVCFSSLAIFLYSYYCNRRQLDNKIQSYCRASKGTQGQSRGAKKSRNSGGKIVEENSGALLRRLFFRCFYFPSSPLAAPGSPR